MISTSFPVYISVLLVSMLGSILTHFGIHLVKFGCQEFVNMLSANDVNITIKQSRLRGGLVVKGATRLVASRGRGVSWEVKLPPGSSEVRKQRREGEGNKEKGI